MNLPVVVVRQGPHRAIREGLSRATARPDYGPGAQQARVGPRLAGTASRAQREPGTAPRRTSGHARAPPTITRMVNVQFIIDLVEPGVKRSRAELTATLP